MTLVKTGIDKIALYTSRYALNLSELANEYGQDIKKYETGLGQLSMSVPPPGEDIVTMAANAAQKVLEGIDKNSITTLMLATESGIDQSKAAGIYVHHLIGLPKSVRVVELKQACYGGTAGLQMAMAHLRENPTEKMLLIAVDIARYGLGTTGESSQGACACAMVLSAHPRLLVIEKPFGVVTENVMDFWRPNYRHEALVDGKYSSRLYLNLLEETFKLYQVNAQLNYDDHSYFCYHTPVPKLVEKAHAYLAKVNQVKKSKEMITEEMGPALHYARLIGNSYTASLYVSIISYLETVEQDLSGQRIGLYSYGSGCVAEFFGATVVAGYQNVLHREYHRNLLQTRTQIPYDLYRDLYKFKYVEDGSHQLIPKYNTGQYRLAEMLEHQRIYEKVCNDQTAVEPCDVEPDETINKSCLHLINANDSAETLHHTVSQVYAPAKLILSGEHAILHGAPALAMAIDRYAVATVSNSMDEGQALGIALTDLGSSANLSFNALRLLKQKIKTNYLRFKNGEFNIRDVLQKPFELAHFALSLLSDSFQLGLPRGVNVQLRSTIPIGCGLGSSAATILCVMRAVANHLRLSLTDDELFQLALEAEHMQHGATTGLDLRVALKGGCLYVCGSEIADRKMPPFPLYLVNTGSPLTTTGQAVADCAHHFTSSLLIDEFTAVTNAMDEALQLGAWNNFKETMQHNHQLLLRIGVVPSKVQRFINTLEEQGGAAKLCGAGATQGEQGGALLIAHEDANTLEKTALQHGYQVLPIHCEMRGVYAA